MPIKYLSWSFAAALLLLLLCVCGVRTQSRTNERTAPSFECVFSVSSFHAFLAVVSHLFNYVSLHTLTQRARRNGLENAMEEPRSWV
jgi:hypothetical protein